MNRKQTILAHRHGTPHDFATKMHEQVGELTLHQIQHECNRYKAMFEDAGYFAEMKGEGKITTDGDWARRWRNDRQFAHVGLTNGCFDLLHAGHVQFLRRARNSCDYLMLLLNSDKSVTRLKGPGRPVNTEMHRALVMSAVEMVDLVFIFNESRITKWLTCLRPDFWFKGGDYSMDTLDKREIEAARRAKCEVLILNGLKGISTTKIYERQKTLG